ncbi:PQQ-dependent sugar dehydrogenase [Pontibacter sp. G13]|uniref:PQQ-dependent sugar dehydrogenase n=1 Tax=Pontibacter sp. G13 TaxID=3074898 RepID=UPI002889BF8A|nr:PQQ-dependent sugar dehydrogenase [Pontibacter sp. G13]WNJ19546.1 PQQ-dependent sugar dehydrogenase [Pontibacter sp. G13]
MLRLFLAFCMFSAGFLPVMAQNPDFIDQSYLSGWNGALGMVFDNNGRMFVWEKQGTVYIVDGGVKSATPLIDISEEVGNWRDHGLLGFALDPNFLNNGYIYLYYVVDRHHLINYGTGSYSAAANEYYNATIGRITRYTAESSTNFTTVDYASRTILLGETVSTGIPILGETHGVGTILFGKDGTLLATCGDGATATFDPGGNTTGSYILQALADGICTNDEDVGSFRCQMLSSLNGKVLRLDPATGDGISSNPFYDAASPRSAKSRTWSLGLRNPYRMTLRPETGSHYPEDGAPGHLYIGDVGWGKFEEMNIVTEPAQNFGWPLYEGVDINSSGWITMYNPDAPTPAGCGVQNYYEFKELMVDPGSAAPSWPDPCNPGNEIDSASYPLFVHTRPTYDWKHKSSGFARVSIDGETYLMSDSMTNPVLGPDWEGNCSVAGTWYEGSDFPAEYFDTYFHADYDANWIKHFEFDSASVPTDVEDFLINVGAVVDMEWSSMHDGIWYIRYGTEIRRVTYSPSGNQPPVVAAVLDTFYAPSNSLTVNFTGSGSTDPEGAALTYFWDFGDGNNSTAADPSHTFSTAGATPASYTITLTVTDTGSLSSQTTLQVWLNNTPPEILSSSMDTVVEYSVLESVIWQLEADVQDAEHTDDELVFGWQTILYHNDHNHPEAIDYNDTTSTLISPIGCDGATYWYEIVLTVTDPEGMADTAIYQVYPHCSPLAEPDNDKYYISESVEVDVFGNDITEDLLDSTSLVIIAQPSHGTASYDPATGLITYLQDGSFSYQDTFYYQVSDIDGDTSKVTMVEMIWHGPPTVNVTYPSDGGYPDNKFLDVTYSISGDTSIVSHIDLILDTGEELSDSAFAGTVTFDDVTLGARTLYAHMKDDADAILPLSTASDTVAFTALEAGSNMKIETGKLTNVDTAWQTVNLPQVYTSMVVVTSVELPDETYKPAVTRITNVTNTSFDLKVQNPSGDSIGGYSVYYMVMEEGVYTDAVDGWNVEAVIDTSWETANSSSWTTEARSYQNTYTNPVVLGQVMSYADEDWSVFWASGKNKNWIPVATWLRAGKHVGDDPDQVRNPELIGYIVLEQGSGKFGGRPFAASVGADNIRGVDDTSDNHVYALSGVKAPAIALTTMAGMDENEGGWAVLYGANAFSDTEILLAVEEDQLDDVERNHSGEQLAYFVMDSAVVDGGTLPVEFLDFKARLKSLNTEVQLDWITGSETNNAYFDIERSQDGVAFFPVGQVSSLGDSQQPQSYQWTDHNPNFGENLYRLKQVDIDGAFSYSEIQSVTRRGGVFTILPNPVQLGQGVEIRIELKQAGSVKFEWINMVGQSIATYALEGQFGDNQMVVPTRALAAGAYSLRITPQNDVQMVEKVIVLE